MWTDNHIPSEIQQLYKAWIIMYQVQIWSIFLTRNYVLIIIPLKGQLFSISPVSDYKHFYSAVEMS